MSKTSTHPGIEFARRFATGTAFYPTLDAGSALWRAESLFDDALELIKLADKAEDAKIQFHRRWYDFEICSYYAVGFVTCLEWHARSRLVDLLTFAPQCMQTSDFQRLNDKALIQAAAHKISVPALAGGLLTVTDVESYVKPFNRVFGEFGSKIDGFALLETEAAKSTVPLADGAKSNLRIELDSLFEYRHRLVHEIGMEHVGPYAARDGLSLKDACEKGANVIQTIKLVETHIAKQAPNDFPHLLDENGVPSHEFDKLLSAIRALETEIAERLITEADESEGNLWNSAVEAWKDSEEKQFEFLSSATFLRPIRHIQFDRPIKLGMLKSRLEFLQLVRADLG